MKTFLRMWEAGSLDPFAPGIAFDTFYCRRAALHFGGVTVLRELTERVRAAVEQQDNAGAAKMSRKLAQLVNKIEAAFDRDPPGKPSALPWEGPASRFHEMTSETMPARGANSKKHVLGKLDRDWDQQLWSKAMQIKFQYLLELAVHLTVPVRPEDMAPGDRATGWSAGVVLRLLEPCCLEISFMPSKSHHGLYGTELTSPSDHCGRADQVPCRALPRGGRTAGRERRVQECGAQGDWANWPFRKVP